MKILFVTVPADTDLSTWYPHLGIAYLSAYLKKHSDWKTTCCDTALGESIAVALRREKPDLIGVTTTSLNYGRAVKAAVKIKELRPETPIIAGGVHVTALPHTVPECFDVVVKGEGEQALLELCNEYEETGKFSKRIYEAPLIEPLDKIPYPDRDIFNMRFYLRDQGHFPNGFGRGTSLMTARGCPFRCVFCSSSRFWQIVRQHSPMYVVNEIEMLIDEYKIKYLNIFDDLFQLNKKRLRELARLFKERNFDIKFTIQAHVGSFDEETAQLLKQMGLGYITFGYESGSDRILKFLKCGVTTVADNRRATRLAKKYGILVGGGFMYGVPTETQADLEANDRFINEEKIDSAAYYACTPYPGTPLWDYAKAKGLVNDVMSLEEWGRLSQRNIGQSLVMTRE